MDDTTSQTEFVVSYKDYGDSDATTEETLLSSSMFDDNMSIKITPIANTLPVPLLKRMKAKRFVRPVKSSFTKRNCFIFLLILAGVCISYWLLRGISGKEEEQVEPLLLTAIKNCDNITSQNVWEEIAPGIISNTQLQLADINNDGVKDVIFGYGSELDGWENGRRYCADFYEITKGCMGGVMALDGQSGRQIWLQGMNTLVYQVDCNFDLNKDRVNDCIVAGKGGLLATLDGSNGSIIWKVEDNVSTSNEIINVYYVTVVPDINDDQVADFVGLNTLEDRDEFILRSSLVFLSGKDGSEIKRISTPVGEGLQEPAFSAPQILQGSDGELSVLYSTGDSSSPGGVYVFPLSVLTRDYTPQVFQLFHNFAGIQAQPILYDVNNDGTQDLIVIASDNVTLINVAEMSTLWTVSLRSFVDGPVPLIAVSGSPTPGYYNDDDTIDFMVVFTVGAQFPTHYYTATVFINGLSGEAISKPRITSAITDVGNAIVLGMEGVVERKGKESDTFFYWTSYCKGHEEATDSYLFESPEDLISQMNADLCQLRFASDTIIELRAVDYQYPFPGFIIYSSALESLSGQLYGFDTLSDSEVTEAMKRLKNTVQNLDFATDKIPIESMSKRIVSSYNAKKNYILNSPNGYMTHGPRHNWKFDSNDFPELYTKEKIPTGNLNMDNENSVDKVDKVDKVDYYNIPDESLNDDDNEQNYQRSRRSVEKHRVIGKVSTSGVAVKSLVGNGMDIIFAVYEKQVSKNVRILTGDTELCVQNYAIEMLRYITNPVSPDKIKLMAFQKCLNNGAGWSPQPAEDRDGYPDVVFGNMRVYRKRLVCNSSKCQNDTCFIPYEKQKWPSRSYVANNTFYLSD